MAIDAKEILAALPKARQKKIQERADAIIAEELGLRQLRELMKRPQATVAEAMGIRQADVSRLERRGDMLVSTLRKYVEGSGGTLELIVRMPNRDAVRLCFGPPGESREDDSPSSATPRKPPQPRATRGKRPSK